LAEKKSDTIIKWQCKSFSELTNEELYKILQLRIEVFAVEQNVVYQDCDNKDFKCYHFTGILNDQLLAYSRIIPPGIAYPVAASIGRVVTSPLVRGQSVGQIPVIISAQVYLVKFYENFSFMQQGDNYIEDSIPHVTMIKNI